MSDFLGAYDAAFRTGSVPEEAILDYVERYKRFDSMVPEAASFYYLHEIGKKKIWFLGKLQAPTTGFSNEASLEMGVDFAFERFHPDDMWVILRHVYPAFDRILHATPREERRRVYAQYNYRLRHFSGEYRNLLERVYVLELDDAGLPSLLLANVSIIDYGKYFPVCFIGKHVMRSGVARVLDFKVFSQEDQVFDTVTAREIEVLRNLSLGKTSRQIAEDLFISKHTVDTHRRHLLGKLGCKSTVGLARFASAHGLV
ncbi:hypothetical protein GM415_17285 [Pseudodesulfovibrio cashew]|uniref:HTH luxR-type domain-containing protein n=1 Tax=Pseudodesulfovibrio cashew TaxID=2678688 RepID=A0A6I6JKT5_9BACT|nr:helix-turn-helix transcriptional regulator [Pseudodesulfovibrio cashew]QGY41799.1 hypothetical protein GM415_17285 [Pseudodesulfovibrio cashew]